MMQDFSDFDFLDKIKNKGALMQKRKEIGPILLDVKRFLKTKGVVLYGGLALNVYLSKENKIYDDDIDIPDYDGYSPRALEIAKALFEHLNKKGYKFLVLKRALHDGTYTIQWEFKAIVDITQVPAALFKTISMSRVTKNGSYFANVNLIKANAYIELASPESSQFRWTKVMRRLQLLEDAVPLQSSASKEDLFTRYAYPQPIENVIREIRELVVRSNLPLVGNDAIRHYLKIRKKGNLNISGNSAIEALVPNPFGLVTKVEKLLGQEEYRMLNYKIVDGNTVIVYAKRESYNILKMHDVSNKCVAVWRPNNEHVTYGSIFYLIYDMYYMLFMHASMSRKTRDVHILRRGIIELMSKVTKNTFTTQCIGYSKTMSVQKLERFRKNIPIVLKSNR